MKILLTGSGGMVGSAVFRRITSHQTEWNVIAPRREELDLRDQQAVEALFKAHRFDAIIHTAARVGGIKANMEDQPGFMTDNLLISTHLIDAAHRHGVTKLINLGSSCMYPRDYRQPLVEEDILAAPLEPTNEGYAIAKIAAAKQCLYLSEKYGLAYRSFIPCNLYGPGDYFHPEKSHLLPATILKIHNAKSNGAPTVEIWGDGTPRREVLYVDDLAEFIVDAVPRLESLPHLLNLGCDKDFSITEIYERAAAALGWSGGFTYKTDAPMGMAHKLMSSAKAHIHGWNPQTQLEQGIRQSYHAFLSGKARL